ncbi:MAG: helix-turn-helix transcriptional regulator [Clostridiales bacterium]|nr:helix-turn-helix transcriptional regulator [Clostridiales bacterium]
MKLMREKREEAHLTQQQLATMIGISRTAITKIENGGRPSVNTAQKIANILGFDWTLFF